MKPKIDWDFIAYLFFILAIVIVSIIGVVIFKK